ncbi:MAG: NAD-dependent deacylase [Chloroflexi bacterium]|nr:NAD-dependent deacylase [Chloroflexota bacterium]
MTEQDFLIEKAAGLVLRSDPVVVFTGAGVSTESGIPDFRGPGGIWSRFDPDEFTYQKFAGSPANRKKHWVLMRDMFMKEYEPNPAHHAIAELDRMGKLDCIITQNVDNLHQKAGVAAEKILELHGNTRFVKCLSCGRRYAAAEIMKRLDEGEEDPACLTCKGILKPDGVFFGEALPQDVLQEAIHHSQHCELFVVIGSTLVVYPAAYMPVYAIQGGAALVIINMTETPMDSSATVVLHEKAGEVLPLILASLKHKLSQKEKSRATKEISWPSPSD